VHGIAGSGNGRQVNEFRRHFGFDRIDFQGSGARRLRVALDRTRTAGALADSAGLDRIGAIAFGARSILVSGYRLLAVLLVFLAEKRKDPHVFPELSFPLLFFCAGGKYCSFAKITRIMRRFVITTAGAMFVKHCGFFA
jgi:hypothetical protein